MGTSLYKVFSSFLFHGNNILESKLIFRHIGGFKILFGIILYDLKKISYKMIVPKKNYCNQIKFYPSQLFFTI